ncbi:MAG: flagellar hook protein FlgE [Fimbriimonas sp.]
MLAGVASIKAQQTRMNVIGDNLANVNTTAFKSSRVTFQEMMSQTMRGATGPGENIGGRNAQQVGLGVMVAGTDTSHEQGSLNATNRPTDLAIQGNGFFMVSNGDRTAYTRDGAFNLDAKGDMVHIATGEKLVGWKADALGKIDTSTAPTSTINIPIGGMSALQATTRVNMTGNLSADATGTDSWSQQVKVYDAQGGAHDLTVKFTNRTSPVTGGPAGADAGWDWEVLEGTTSLGSSATAGNGQIFFDAAGKGIAPAALGKITLGGAPIEMNFGGISGVKAATQVALKDQNGFPPGSLQSFSMGPDGVITGLFTNGLTRPLGQVATAVFTNPGGLERTGGNLFRATDNAGTPNIGAPNSGGRGGMASGYLEQSNVDIGQEFTDLIITQRGFQANTKIVTTVDEMMQELLSLKR